MVSNFVGNILSLLDLFQGYGPTYFPGVSAKFMGVETGSVFHKINGALGAPDNRV